MDRPGFGDTFATVLCLLAIGAVIGFTLGLFLIPAAGGVL